MKVVTILILFIFLFCRADRFIDKVNNDGRTALMISCISHGNFEMTNGLLYGGPSCHIKDTYGSTALDYCKINNRTESVLLLEAYGCSNDRDSLWDTLPSCDVERFKDIFNSSGISPNIRNNQNCALISRIMRYDCFEILRILVKHDDVNVNLVSDVDCYKPQDVYEML